MARIAKDDQSTSAWGVGIRFLYFSPARKETRRGQVLSKQYAAFYIARQALGAMLVALSPEDRRDLILFAKTEYCELCGRGRPNIPERGCKGPCAVCGPWQLRKIETDKEEAADAQSI